MMEWKENQERKIDRRRKDELVHQMKEYKIRPEMCPGSKTLVKLRTAKMGQCTVEERLTAMGQVYDQKKERAVQMDSTKYSGIPDIDIHSKSLFREGCVQNRLYALAKEQSAKRCEASEDYLLKMGLDASTGQPLHVPHINAKSKSLDFSEPASCRLTKYGELYTERRRKCHENETQRLKEMSIHPKINAKSKRILADPRKKKSSKKSSSLSEDDVPKKKKTISRAKILAHGARMDEWHINRVVKTKQLKLEMEQEEMKECHFQKERVTTLSSPRKISVQDSRVFYDKMTEWKNTIVDGSKRKSVHLKASELEGCTFKPVITPSPANLLIEKKIQEAMKKGIQKVRQQLEIFERAF